MRIPLGTSINSRQASITKDARIVNGYVDSEGHNKRVVKRPGLSLFTVTPSLPVATAQGMFAFKGDGNLYVVLNNTVYQITPSGVSTNIGTVASGLYSFTQTEGVPYLFLHNSTNAYVYNAKTLTFSAVTDPNFPSITTGAASFTGYIGSAFTGDISGTILTVTAISSGNIEVGQTLISNYIPSGVTIVSFLGGSGSTGTYVISTNLGTIASTTITGQGNILHVTAVASGTVAINTLITDVTLALIAGTTITATAATAVGDVSTWQISNSQYVASEAMTSPAVTGRTLCPGAVYLDDTIYVMTTDGRIYNSAIENATSWNALNYIVKSSEPDGGVSIVKHLSYLIAFGAWSAECYYDAANATGSPLSRNDSYKMEVGCANASSIVQHLSVQSVCWVGQSREQGRGVYWLSGFFPQKISTRAIDTFLNADPLINVRSYGISIAGHPLYILTLKDTGYTFVYDFLQKEWYQWTSDNGLGVEGFFTPEFFSTIGSTGYLLDGATGNLFTFSSSMYQDNTRNINFRVVTDRLDGGTNKHKFQSSLEVIGDKSTNAGIVTIRYSDDDYNTWSAYRPVDITQVKPVIYQLGYFRRRAFDLLHITNEPYRIEALEANIIEGTV